MKKYLSYICFLLCLSSGVLGDNGNNIIETKRKGPGKVKIGVHKLKTKELNLDFNKESKIIYGELPNYKGEMVFVSEKLDEIPSIKTAQGKRIINKIKTIKINNPIKTGKFTYEIINNKDNNKNYIKITTDSYLEGVYIYILENGTYKIKEIYKGKFKDIDGLKNNYDDSKSRHFKINFDKDRNGAVRLGRYTLTEEGVYNPKGQLASYIKLDGNFKEVKNNLQGKVDKIKIYLGDLVKEYNLKNREKFEGVIDVPRTGGEVKFLGDKNSPYLNFELMKWDKGFNETFVIEYIKTVGIQEEIIQRDYIELSLPEKIKTNSVNIRMENPLVIGENQGIGLVESNEKILKTYGSNKKELTKNNPWITVENPMDYRGKDLGKHKIVYYDGASHREFISGDDGSFIGQLPDNNFLINYLGGESPSTLLALTDYKFTEIQNKNIKMIHYYPEESGIKEPAYVYEYIFNVEKFDGYKYYDEGLSTIKLAGETVAKYKPEEGNYINLGKVILKDLDTRVTNKNGGTGIRIVGEEKVYLKNLKNPSEPLLEVKLEFKNSNGANGGVKNNLIGKNEEKSEDDIYLILDEKTEGKLLLGGQYEVVNSRGENPLKIGLEVNGDNLNYFKPLGKLIVEADLRYIESRISIIDGNIPLDIPANKGWIRINGSEYFNGLVEGYNKNNWGSVYNPVDIPLNAKLEIYDSTWKVLSTDQEITEVPLDTGNKLKIKHIPGNNYIAVGYERGQYVDIASGGAEGTYYLKFTNGKGRVLFIQKLYVSLGNRDKEMIVEFYNPVEIWLNDGNSDRGLILIDKNSAPAGKEANIGNSNSDNFDGMKTNWFKVYNAPETAGKRLILRDKNGTRRIGSSPLAITGPDGKARFQFVMYNNMLGISFASDDYRGQEFQEEVHLEYGMANAPAPIKVILKAPDFNISTYYGYGGIYLMDTYRKNQVGTGSETIFPGVSSIKNIKLQTILTTLKYSTNFLKFLPMPHGKNIEVKQRGVKVKAISNTPGDPVVEGILRFGDLDIGGFVDNVFVVPKSVGNYDINLQLSPKEYKKLLPRRKYEIFTMDGDKNVLEIGVLNSAGDGFIGKPFQEIIKFDKPMNFVTSPPDLEIYGGDIDFGKFNVYEKSSVRRGNSKVFIKGNDVTEYTVSLMGEVSPTETILYKDLDGEKVDNSSYMNVTDLKIEMESEKVEENQWDKDITRIYDLSGVAHYDKATAPEGKYSGDLWINVEVNPL